MAPMICPHCWLSCSDDAKFCEHCGTQLKSIIRSWKEQYCWYGFLLHPKSGKYYAVTSDYGRILQAAGPLDDSRIKGPASEVLAEWPDDTDAIGKWLQKEIAIASVHGIDIKQLY